MRRLFTALFAFLLLTGCTQQSAQRSTFAMDTIMTVTVYGDNSEQAADSAISLINKLSSQWSVTDATSEIYALNSSGEAVLSDDTALLIHHALDMSDATNGAFDITLYPILREWGFTADQYQVPNDERLAELLQYTGSNKVTINGSTATLESGTKIDLGAIAKGYTGDLVSEQLISMGIENALLDLGGNIHAIGSNPDGDPWKLGVRDPHGDGSIAFLSLTDAAAVTSGGYERFFIAEDGTRYCHILDPATGKPANSGLASVTVVGSEGWLCDAVSTAVYVMGAQKGMELQQKLGGFELLLITDNGDIMITEGLQQALTTAEGFSGTVTVMVS